MIWQLSYQSRAHPSALSVNVSKAIHFDMGIAFLFIGAIAYPKKDLLGPQRQCTLCARVEAEYAVKALHDALANVHDGRPLHAEHVILRLKQPPHGLGQREKARVALQNKVTRTSHTVGLQLNTAVQTPHETRHVRTGRVRHDGLARTHLPIIRGEAGVHVCESVGESSVYGGGTRGDARCLVTVFARLE
jgi:hypothetical protein